MAELSRFQDAFGAALGGEPGSLAPWLGEAPDTAPGLAVYRNTVAAGAIDALAAIYTTVSRMVGEDWFRAAAAVYADEHPPSTPSLLAYGAEFPAWLSRFVPAMDTPYLPAIARLDRLWWESYFAAEGPTLAPLAISGLGADDLESTRLVLHPSARLAKFEQNLASLWLAHRAPGQTPDDFAITDQPQCVLIVRAGLDIQAQIIDRARHAFLAACLAGEALLTAADRAVAADPSANLADIIGASLATGVFSRLEPSNPGPCQ